jgi:hypothetical protein
VVYPGAARRTDALMAAGRRVGPVMIGVTVMLCVAGALEGAGRQMVTLDLARWAIGGTIGAAWLAYFYAPRFLGPRTLATRIGAPR